MTGKHLGNGGKIWVSVPGTDDRYQVTRTGRVRGPRGELKGTVTKHGYVRVTLYVNGQKRLVFVHQLVLETFVGPCPPGLEACHWDDVPGNNRLSNLRWGTKSENMKDKVRNGNHNMSRKTRCSRGHRYTPENTYLRPSGGRGCKQCVRERSLAYYHRNKERNGKVKG